MRRLMFLAGLASAAAVFALVLPAGAAGALGNGAATPFELAFSSGGADYVCTGSHIANATTGMVKDSETCSVTGDTSMLVAGTYSGDPYGSVPWVDHPIQWVSDYDGTSIATRWSLTFVDNGDGTWTMYAYSYYSEASAPGGGAATPFEISYNWFADFACTGNHIVNATTGMVKDSETCSVTGDTSMLVAGTYSGDPYGSVPWIDHPMRWVSDYDTTSIATSWSMTLVDNGDGTWTMFAVSYYSEAPTPGGGAATPFELSFSAGGTDFACTGNHIVNAKTGMVKDSETCSVTGDTSKLVAGTYSGDPWGSMPLVDYPTQWMSDYDGTSIATRWSLTFVDNGDGTWTMYAVSYY